MASLVKSEKKEASVALSPSDEPLPQLGAQINIQDVDEAFAFLEDHPHRTELAAEASAILEDPVQLKKLIRKIDWTIAPLLAATLVMLICLIPTILGAALMIGLDPTGHPTKNAGLLAASFLSGTFGAGFMIMLAWNASNIAGHSKKDTANALTLVAFSVGNILGTQTFQARQAPGYTSGKASILGTLVAAILVISVLRLYNDRLNRKNTETLAGTSEGEKSGIQDQIAFADLSDRKNPFFVYTH